MKIPNLADRVWLFDYDLTLYAERAIIESLDLRISLFVQKTVQCPFEEAVKIRKDYLHRFGTTLAGLRSVHGVLPDDYFDFIHEPEHLTYPVFSLSKLEMLRSIRGSKYVFTNGRSDWSRAGISRMGISECFRKVVGLENLGWEGKPSEGAYEKMEEVLLADGVFRSGDSLRKIILLDDSLKNLKPAHDRGWTTVWVNADSPENGAFADARISSLMDLPRFLESVPDAGNR